jgi:hypothetical protein
MKGRRGALAVGLAVVAAWAGVPAAGAALAAPARPGLARPRSLRAELDKAARMRKALVVLVSLDHCAYCEAVRASHLVPLAAGGQPVVQVDMGSAAELADLRGQAATHRQVVSALGVRLAPTVLFLGPGGSEAAARLEGFASADFYGAYLEERVQAANHAVAAR